jgi:hypothetical protein
MNYFFGRISKEVYSSKCLNKQIKKKSFTNLFKNDADSRQD